LDPVRVTEDTPRLISQQVMETLVTYDENLQLQPLLAESWQMLEGGREWVFRIRSNVRFHDDPSFGGTPRFLTAGDVAYSLHRVLDPKTQTLGAFILSDVLEGAEDYASSKSAAVSGILVKDSRTIRFKLTKPYPFFPVRLSLPFCAVVPREAVERYGFQFGTHPIGTGRFRFRSWDLTNGEIQLESNPHYWRPSASALEGVTFRVMKSDTSLLADFAGGRLDTLEAGPTVFRQITDSEGRLKPQFSFARLTKVPTMTVHFVGFNFRNPLCRDKNFRLACNYAVDKEKLCDFVLGGLAAPANGPLPPELPGGDHQPLFQQDLERARKLLAASPYKGQELLYLTDNSTQSVAVAEFLQDQLGAIGIKIRIDKNPESVWVDKLTKGNFDLGKLYFAFDYPGSDNGLSQFLQTNFAPAGPNFLHYANREFDRIYDQAVREADPAAASSFFARLQGIVREDAPWIFLYSPLRILVVRGETEGIKINSLSFSLILDNARKVPR
jgi:peptide/nickel transport system substrate-binding protein